jgi:hypothetical protein
MNEPISTLFGSEAEFRAALDTAIASAVREIQVFDNDLTRMMLDEKRRAEAIENFLAGATTRRLRIVLHQPAHVETNAARLRSLIRRFSNSIEVRESAAHFKHIADCFLIADGEHAAIRFHRDHARGKLLQHAPEQVRPWSQRFDELWMSAVPCMSPTKLGL